MSKQRIHIENLKIRLPRSARANAREIAGGLGQEILKGVARAAGKLDRGVRLEELSAGRVPSAGGAADIQKRAAAAVEAELVKRLS